jgi:hypothetical protein
MDVSRERVLSEHGDDESVDDDSEAQFDGATIARVRDEARAKTREQPCELTYDEPRGLAGQRPVFDIEIEPDEESCRVVQFYPGIKPGDGEIVVTVHTVTGGSIGEDGEIEGSLLSTMKDYRVDSNNAWKEM